MGGARSPRPQQPTVQTPPQVSVSEEVVMRTLTRAVLASRAAHGSTRDYVKAVARLWQEGVPVGDKYHTRHHAEDVTYLAARCVESMAAEDFRVPLAGLGIPSSFAVLMDGVPLGGAGAFGRHGQVNVICVLSVSSATHRLHSWLAGWFVARDGHGGPALSAGLLEQLRRAPLSLALPELRARLTLIGGDGALVRGGPERKSNSTGAAELAWGAVFPSAGRPRQGPGPGRGPGPPPAGHTSGPAPPPTDGLGPRPQEGPAPPLSGGLVLQPSGGLVPRHTGSGAPRPGSGHAGQQPVDGLAPQPADGPAHVVATCTEWDKMHREDIALVSAIRETPMAEELFLVSSMMDKMFHLGDGRLVLRRAAEEIGVRFLYSGRLPGGTRKAVALTREPGHLLSNFRAYAAGVHLRREWRQQAKAGTYTLEVLVDAGRRLTALDFVCFALAFRDTLRVAAPWVASVQADAVEPWTVAYLQRRHTSRLCGAEALLGWLRDLVRVVLLLCQHSPPEARRRLLQAAFYASPDTFFCCPGGTLGTGAPGAGTFPP